MENDPNTFVTSNSNNSNARVQYSHKSSQNEYKLMEIRIFEIMSNSTETSKSVSRPIQPIQHIWPISQATKCWPRSRSTNWALQHRKKVKIEWDACELVFVTIFVCRRRRAKVVISLTRCISTTIGPICKLFSDYWSLQWGLTNVLSEMSNFVTFHFRKMKKVKNFSFSKNKNDNVDKFTFSMLTPWRPHLGRQ